MERVDCGQDFALFVDAADTACSLRATLRTARQLCNGRVICVLGDSLPRDAGEAAVIRSVVNKLADVAIVTDALTAADAAWLPREANQPNLQVAADRGEAIAWAVAMAGQGDVVVIAGSRTPTEFTFGSAEISDADAARELLYALAQPALRLVG
jgi:UDP-N-acetylmuramoyl-L-alanyl-D-glutamate--2,6-diaminopimelate ligase